MSVKYENRILTVDQWNTADADIASFFGSVKSEEVEDQFVRALKIGVLSLRGSSTHVNVDYVEKTFNTLQKKLEEEFDQRIHSINQQLEGHLVGKSSSIYKVLDHTRDESPLASLKKEIKEAILWAMENVIGAEAAKEVFEAGTEHGREHEKKAYERGLEPMARSVGDLPEFTHNTQGNLGPTRKVGDAVVTLNSRYTGGIEGRVVYEFKDRAVGITELRRELEECKQNRGAVVAVAAFKKIEDMPTDVRYFAELPGNCFVCTYDPGSGDTFCLEFTYRVAKLATIKQCASNAGRVIDMQKLDQLVAQIRTDLRATAAIKQQLSSTKTYVDGIVAKVEELEINIKNRLDEVDLELRKDPAT